LRFQKNWDRQGASLRARRNAPGKIYLPQNPRAFRIFSAVESEDRTINNYKNSVMKKIILSAMIVASTLGLRAQSILWGTPQTITGASDVVTAGTLFGSWAPFDTSSASYPVNGVTFAPLSLPNFNYTGFPSSSTGFGSPATANNNYNYLLQSGDYSGNAVNNPGSVISTLTWGGMNAGDTYEVEFWVEDARNLGFSRSEYVSGGGVYGTDTSSALSFPANGSGNGQFITGTFVAGSGTITIGLTPVSSAANEAVAQINLLQVRDISAVPEPGTLALAGIGGLGLLLKGIRRRA
jgi:PEP-CTERM motif-containing protein